MADGGGGQGAAVMILFWLVFSIMPNLKDSKDYLKSIDKKTHTHAADGSVNGIRGWY